MISRGFFFHFFFSSKIQNPQYYRRGLPLDYDGGRDLNALSSWALRKTSPPVQQITAEAAKTFNHGFLGTFSEEGRKAFSAAAIEIEFDGWQFGEVSAEVAKE